MFLDYIDSCVRLGYITQEPIREYSLRKSSLACVAKMYANTMRLPYKLNFRRLDSTDKKYYLTDQGLDWFFNSAKVHSLAYLRKTFGFLFTHAKPENLNNPSDYVGFNNLHGSTGVKPKKGTKRPAVIVRTHKRTVKEYFYPTVRAARKALVTLLTYNPAEEFEIFAIRKDNHRVKLKLVVSNSKQSENMKKIIEERGRIYDKS